MFLCGKDPYFWFQTPCPPGKSCAWKATLTHIWLKRLLVAFDLRPIFIIEKKCLIRLEHVTFWLKNLLWATIVLRIRYKLCNIAHDIICDLGSVQFSRSVMSNSLWPHESQHSRPPCPSPTPRVHSDSRPSSPWCHPTISSSVVPFSSCPQSLPASESFPMS